MSYCVKCGVELDEGAERCPLCGTPAWKPDETEPRYFPTKPAEVPRASRRAAAALLTAMLASVSLCCGLLNLILPTEHPWGALRRRRGSDAVDLVLHCRCSCAASQSSSD